MVHCARISCREAVAAIERVGGTIRFNWESKSGKLISKGKPSAPGFLVDFVGADFFGHVTDVRLSPNANDAILVHVGRLSRPKCLDISGPWLNRSNPRPNRSQSQVSDKGVENLNGLSELESLDLRNTEVSDDGLEVFGGLTGLVSLSLGNSRVTDSGLVHLAGLTKLVTLDLGCTQVRGNGLKHLKNLPRLSAIIFQGSQATDACLADLSLTRLKLLDLRETWVSASGVDEFERRQPNVVVHY